jgi:hypothetical protein
LGEANGDILVFVNKVESPFSLFSSSKHGIVIDSRKLDRQSSVIAHRSCAVKSVVSPHHAMSDSEELIIYPVPSLVATLLNRERAKGSPLTEQEVIEIRDACPAIALRPEDVRKIEERRGYKDIDPENCWEEWQKARKDLIDGESSEA